MPTSTESTAPSSNGELIDRVQQLRLAGQLASGVGHSRGSWLPWVLCGMMAVTWAGVGVRWYRAPDPNTASGGAAGAPGAKPAGGAASGSPTGTQHSNQPAVPQGELLFPIKGTLTPSLQINLSPDDVSGTVTEIFFKEGDRVKKGQRLATIRDDRYRNDYSACEAALVGAQKRLEDLCDKAVRREEKIQAEGDLDEAKAAWERADLEVKRLSTQRTTGVVSAQDLERADTDLKGAAAKVSRLKATLDLLNMGARKEKIQAAEADVKNARAKYDEAKRMLDNCVVVAPIDGTILTKVADKGVLVSPMSFNVAAGICSMADLSDLEAEIEVREDQITQVRTGLRCEVAAAADPNRVYKGRVDRIMPIADDTKNVIKVRVKVELPKGEEPGVFLKPKMTTTVRVYNAEIPEFDAPK